MSNTSELSTSAKVIQSTPPKQTDLKSDDLQLVAERLALIQGHISHMPDFCISGVVVMDGFLLVALKVKDHELSIENGAWMLDKKDVTIY